jgi:hypothetical protein
MKDEPRLEQVSGVWLLAKDLRDASRLPSLRLGQHHIAAHRTWGVAAGLEVRADDGELTVTAGCAVDRCGRTGILPVPFEGWFEQAHESIVVLALCGDGPAARVLLRSRAQVRHLDIPLATIDREGHAQAGDGNRQWLRRPGPIRRLGGTIARGAPVSGTASVWTAHVDLARHRLDSPPAVVASPAGGPAGEKTSRTTVEVTTVVPEGFDLVVRHCVTTDLSAPAAELNAAPHALSWLALLPAARTSVPNPLEST